MSTLTRRLHAVETTLTAEEQRRHVQERAEAISARSGVPVDDLIRRAEEVALEVVEKHERGISIDQITDDFGDLAVPLDQVRTWVSAILKAQGR